MHIRHDLTVSTSPSLQESHDLLSSPLSVLSIGNNCPKNQHKHNNQHQHQEKMIIIRLGLPVYFLVTNLKLVRILL